MRVWLQPSVGGPGSQEGGAPAFFGRAREQRRCGSSLLWAGQGAKRVWLQPSVGGLGSQEGVSQTFCGRARGPRGCSSRILITCLSISDQCRALYPRGVGGEGGTEGAARLRGVPHHSTDYFCFLKPRWRQIYRARHLSQIS